MPRVRARILAPRLVLGAIVVVSAVVHAVRARVVVMPSVFPDEYLYSQLGRSLATAGQLRVRGVNPHFLPVLQPILTAPVWWAGSTATAFRLLQLENAFVLSLAAVPAYLIARRLGARSGLAYGVAVLTVATPFGLFAGMILSEPFAYPLELAVVAAALAALDRPSRRAQLTLLVLVGLACFDRLQLAALPICIAVAVIVVGLREHRLRAALREQSLLVGVSVAAFAGGVGIALWHGFGYYKLHPHATSALEELRLGGVSLYVIVLGAGIAIMPSAVVGLALALAKPRTRAELAFGTLTASFLAVTVVQCALWGDVHRVQERYLGYLLPLLALCFALRITRRERSIVPELGVAAAIAVVAVLVPLNAYAIDGAHNLSPTLYAFDRVQQSLHAANAALVFAVGATLLALVGVVAHRAALAMSIAASLVLLVAATAWSSDLTTSMRQHTLPADREWVDHGDGGRATMLVVGKPTTGKPYNVQDLVTLIWNRSITHVVRMPGARDIDWLHDPTVHVASSGAVTFKGRPVRGSVLVSGSLLTSVALRDARLTGSYWRMALWRPRGDAQLAAVVDNRIADGRIVGHGTVAVWGGSAHLAGWVVMRAFAPPALGRAHVHLGAASVSVPSGKIGTIRVRACGEGPWRGALSAQPEGPIDGVWTSVVVSVPRYVPDPNACR
jgi:hypothetical protein